MAELMKQLEKESSLNILLGVLVT